VTGTQCAVTRSCVTRTRQASRSTAGWKRWASAHYARDTLWFVHRHHASLASAEHIASLLGYPTGEVVAALEALEDLGLARRSRVSQAARLYEFAAPSDPQRADALDRLTSVADSRTGRLLLAKVLRRGAPGDVGRPLGLSPVTTAR
jgi:hypothetical protein